MTETVIDLPSLADFMVGAPESESPATTLPNSPAAEEPKKRHRRTKAQIEEDRLKAEAGKTSPPPDALEFLPDGVTPSPFTPEHSEAAASVLGYQSAEQRERILAGEKEVVNGVEQEVLPNFEPAFPSDTKDFDPRLEAPPDASDYQVLVDEIHYLREEMRDLTSEIRKLALAVARSAEVQEAPKS